MGMGLGIQLAKEVKSNGGLEGINYSLLTLYYVAMLLTMSLSLLRELWAHLATPLILKSPANH